MSPVEEIRIDRRFNGPPDSANGGYACGLLGGRLDGPFEATLHLPPPLERPLRLDSDGEGGVILGEHAAVIATARPADPLGEEPPLRPTLEQARAASGSSRALSDHPYPTCFVCGPEHGDGLGVYPGPVPDAEGVHAAPLEPGPGLPLDGGGLASEIVCAALDCPSFPWSHGAKMLLGRLSSELIAPVESGGRYVVVGWPIASEGRKHTTASAVLAEDGTLLARSLALWIEPRS